MISSDRNEEKIPSSASRIIGVIGDETLVAEVVDATSTLDGATEVVSVDGAPASIQRRLNSLVVDVELAPEEIDRQLGQVEVEPLPWVGAYRAQPENGLESLLVGGVRRGCADFVRRPCAGPELVRTLDRVARLGTPATSAHPASGSGRITAIVASKGGVGVSTLATQLSHMLASSSAGATRLENNTGQVLLVDADLQWGSCAELLQLDPNPNIADVPFRSLVTNDDALSDYAQSHAAGFDVLSAPVALEAAMRVTEQDMIALLEAARREYNDVVIDLPCTIDGTVLSILDMATNVVVVTDPTVASVRATQSLLKVLADLDVDPFRIRVVYNETRSRNRTALPPQRVADALDREIEATVPYEKRVAERADLGELFDKARSGYHKELARFARLFAPAVGRRANR